MPGERTPHGHLADARSSGRWTPEPGSAGTRELEIGEDENSQQLSQRLAVLAADAIEEALDLYSRGRLEWIEQELDLASLAPKLDRADSVLDFGQSAVELARAHSRSCAQARCAWPAGRRDASNPGSAVRARSLRCRTGYLPAEGGPHSADRHRGWLADPEPRAAGGRQGHGHRRLPARTRDRERRALRRRRSFAPNEARKQGDQAVVADLGDDSKSARRTRRRRGRPAPREEERAARRASPTLSRLLATRVLERVERTQAYADIALHHALARSALSGADRALTTELVYGTLRWRGRIDFYLSKLLNQELESLEPLVASTLRLGAYQILFCDRIPESAAVDQAVHCARAVGSARATGLVNAVLRRLAREAETLATPTLEEDPLAHLVHDLSLPRWIASRCIDLFGAEEAARFAEACNRPPPLTARANRLRITRDELVEKVRPRFPDARACEISPDGVRLGHGGDPGQDDTFRQGLYTVQDEASQLVVDLLDPQPGERVLDTCAAPGTKTTAIAERTGDTGLVLALDRNARRLGLVARAARRLQLPSVHTLQRDATRSLHDLPIPGAGPADADPHFDRVLVDAPCSGLGSMRRNPDARWRVRPEDAVHLVEIQKALLARAAEVLRKGGCLVYSTCTVLPEENQALVQGFLEDNPATAWCPGTSFPRTWLPSSRRTACCTAFPTVTTPTASSPRVSRGSTDGPAQETRENRAVDPGRRLRSSGRRDPGSGGGWRGLDPRRCDGRALRAEHHHRSLHHPRGPARHLAAARRAPDDREARALHR